MAKERGGRGTPDESVISIIGSGMRVLGDVRVEGTVRIEGRVRGNVSAGKAVVLGKEGVVEGDVVTYDAVLSGTVRGTVVVASRLDLQASCRIEGEVRARRLQLEDGAVLNGSVTMGEEVTIDPSDGSWSVAGTDESGGVGGDVAAPGAARLGG